MRGREGDGDRGCGGEEVRLELAVRCGFLEQVKAAGLEQHYEHILGKLVIMLSHPDQWTIRAVREEEAAYDA